MRRPTLIAVLAALGLVACARGGLPPEQVEAWVGRPAAELVREWGIPTKEIDDAGQRVMIYEEVERTKSADFSPDASLSSRSAGLGPAPPPATALGYSSYARSYLFWVDAAGKITRTQIRQP
jgi:hypothetical protein